MSNLKRIMSIDASTNSLAFAIFEGENLLEYGKINFSGNNTYEKVVDAGQKVRAFMYAHQRSITAIVIEHTVFMNSPKTAADLALVQGAILGAAGVQEVKSVAPITWQNYFGNKKLTKEEKAQIVKDNPGKSVSWFKSYERNVRKQRTINLVNINYDKIVTDNDVADAIGIGHYAINNWGKLTV